MIIIYGGAFNPPTKAHYEIIKAVHEILKPESFVLLPVGNQYNKKDLVSFNHRYNMLSLMKKHLPFITISRLEELEYFKGTVNSLDALQESYKNRKLVLLIGADQYNSLDKWIDYERLIKNYALIVVTRPKYEMDLTKYDHLGIKVSFLQHEIDISSTQIRTDLSGYKNNLIEEVYDYIIKENLYSG